MNKLYILFALLIFANTSYAVSRFDPILKEIIKFQEFEIDTEETQNKLNTSNIKSDIVFDQKNELSNKFHNELIDIIYKKAIELINNNISGNDFLEHLLLLRFNFVADKFFALNDKTNFVNIIPLNEELFELWNNKFNSSSDECLNYNKIMRLNNITRYQIIVKLIKKTFSLLTIDDLNPKVIKLLRASPFLWPILQNKTLNFGHQDESGGYIKIQTYMKYFKIDFTKAIAKILLNTHCPLWEKKKTLYDAYCYESHFVSKKRFIESKNLGADGSGIIYTLTDYEAGECDDLPYPDFLKVQPERPFIESERFFDTFNFDTFNDEINEFEETPILSTKANLSSENIINIIDTNNIINSSELTPSESVSNDTIENNITSDSDNDYLLPSGIRKFHNLMPEAPYPPLNLKKKHQKFVDRIFNSKTSHTISYGEFKKFWKKMNGQIIEDTGSSHKQLIGPSGDPLYGVSAHNDAHTYGKNTIKYFRAALYYIGCRPS